MHPAIHVFGITLPTFGMMMCVGMLAGFGLLYGTRRYTRFSEDDMLSAALWSILLGLLGAKILYWITELKAIIANPAVFTTMLTQGFVFYGSLIGGLAGMYIFCRRHKLHFLEAADFFLPALALGQAFGRIGCFLAGCCYGCRTDGWLSVVFPEGCAAPAGVPLVPTQLLESAFLFILTVILVWILSKKRTNGTVAGWYCVLYGVWRFIIEFFRSDARGSVGALSTSQFIGIFVILVGVGLLYLIKSGRIVSRETSEGAAANPADHAGQAPVDALERADVAEAKGEDASEAEGDNSSELECEASEDNDSAEQSGEVMEACDSGEPKDEATGGGDSAEQKNG